MMTPTKTCRLTLFVLIVLFCSNAYGNNAVTVSGDASQEVVGAAINLASASSHFSAASLYLGGSVVIAVGKPVAGVVLQSAEVSMDTVAFSAEVLTDGLITTVQLSKQLAGAGIELSADAALLAAQATLAGIDISTDTAALFLHQAVNIAAASGKLSGEVATLTGALAAAGVELSVDSAILVANAAKAGIEVSEESAKQLIAACLAISQECIDAAVITERYLVMTLEEANKLLYETSMATVAATKNAGAATYAFTMETAGLLKDLGIDSAKYAKELSVRSAKAGVKVATVTMTGANDVIVVVINTGSGLIVASLNTITASVQEATNKIEG